MDYFIISIAAFGASGLTLFSGFGLGTILMPVFAVFFPLELAISLTAIVHLANNVFKLVLVGRNADRRIVFKFGIPAMAAAFFGAWCLRLFSEARPIFSYVVSGKVAEIAPLKLIMAILMVFFAFMKLSPGYKSLTFDQKLLPWGGALSGFFGGLSGHQGAFRSVFLIQCGLTKESFIGTGIVIACLIDVARLTVYSSGFSHALQSKYWPYATTGVLCAFAGAWLGNRWIKKVTIENIQVLVSALLFLIALGLASGII